ncbi:MAG: RagB/SusD family nutrient uptake outer membrane protein [Tannerellaceae bacterium]|jgi:hypothetical protein|nr:RagB/SusD family nutrient uptake outer membrane protein [Tannerellaceae bacterium]
MKMKYKTVLMAIAFTGAALLSSCSDFMDLKPADQYTEEDFFSSAGLTQGMINMIYSYVKDGSREHVTTGLTDDAYFTHNYGQIAVNEANVSESDLQWYNDGSCPFQWRECYKGIYYANLVLENIGKVPQDNDYDLNVMKGETYFLRAYLYVNLVRGFGGVPIVDKTYGLDEAQTVNNIPRSNIGDCLDFILKDLTEAEKLLKPTAPLGRATSGAATALKARILLHVASPLFADRSVNTLDVNQYTGNRSALYQAALDAAKTVINSGDYKLVDCPGVDVYEVANKYHAIAISNNTEMIFTKQFASSKVVNNLPLQHGPNGYHNWSGTTPTQDFVVHFEMEDGSLSGSSGLSKPGEFKVGNPYLGREPRFYANVGFDGSVWGRKRPSDAFPLDPTDLGQLQCGIYEISDGVNVTVNLPEVGQQIKFTGVYGIDTRQGPIEDWNGSWTSYYEKKLVDTSVDGQNYPQVVPYPHIRLAEMYLIAAEAAIELDKLEEAVTFIDAIRGRIYIPDTKTALAARGQSFAQADMREFIRQERRSELSFEDSRYYDVRRWMIAPVTNNKTLTGMTVFARLKPGKTASRPYIHNEDTWEYHYYVRDLSGSFQENGDIPASAQRERRKWDNKMYFAPILRDEIKRNPSLVQNPGMN